MIDLVDLFRKGAYCKGTRRTHAEPGGGDDFIDAGCHVLGDGNPVVKRFVANRGKFGGGYRYLLALDSRVRKKQFCGLSKFSASDSYFHCLSSLATLWKNSLQVRVRELSVRQGGSDEEAGSEDASSSGI